MDFRDYLKLFDEKNQSMVPDSQYSDVESTGQDNVDRQKLVEDAVKAKRWSLIPQAIAGAGDTLSAANSVYGGPGTGGAQANVNKEIAGNIADTSTQFEKGIADNPTSDSSKQYQNLLGRFLGKDPSSFAHMSASQIKDQIPAIEKLANMENQKSTKELGLAALMSNKDEAQKNRAASSKIALGEKSDQFNQKEWDKLVKDVNPDTATSRSPLGMASRANQQADRALTTLMKPMVTKQEAGNAMADLASIYQNGSPTQYGMSEQAYNTLYGRVKAGLQELTGKPEDAIPDAIKSRLIDDLQQLKGVNTGVINRNLDFIEKSKEKVISNFPEEWKQMRAMYATNPTSPKSTPMAETPSAGIPQPGGMYNGEKVISVKRIK